MKQQFDLHIHTSYSDGQHNLKTVIKKIKESNIKIFSITDHDSVDSVIEMSNYDLSDMKYIKGIEISSILDNKYKLHILGYYFDENNALLQDIITKLKIARKRRFVELAKIINEKYNFYIDEKDINDVVNNVNIPAKPHLAELMIKYGYVKSVPEAFKKYLEDIKTTISNRMDAEIVIKAIKDAGGIAIWAHPKKVEKKYNLSFEMLMPRLLQLGIDGIEVYNSLHSYEDCIRYLNYANKNCLIISGGSDYHGEKVKPDVKLGVIYTDVKNVKIDVSSISLLEVSNFR